MSRTWDQPALQRYIDEAIEESLTLDYKAGEALMSGHGRRREIAKDVSAMANAAGGLIIYGIAENQTGSRHRPAGFAPVDRRKCSKETLEQIISSNIQPRLSGIKIYPVPLDPADLNAVAYVVSIPQSDTVHQVTRSKRYYKRFNFESVPMEDYEIRDVLNRSAQPEVESRVGHISWRLSEENSTGRQWHVPIFATNRSLVVAKDTAITVEFINSPDHQIETDRFQIKTQPKPTDHAMYIATFADAIHRGLDKYFGTFRITIPEPQSLQMRIQVFSGGMRAKWWTVKLNFGDDNATLQIVDDGYLY